MASDSVVVKWDGRAISQWLATDEGVTRALEKAASKKAAELDGEISEAMAVRVGNNGQQQNRPDGYRNIKFLVSIHKKGQLTYTQAAVISSPLRGVRAWLAKHPEFMKW